MDEWRGRPPGRPHDRSLRLRHRRGHHPIGTVKSNHGEWTINNGEIGPVATQAAQGAAGPPARAGRRHPTTGCTRSAREPENGTKAEGTWRSGHHPLRRPMRFRGGRWRRADLPGPEGDFIAILTGCSWRRMTSDLSGSMRRGRPRGPVRRRGPPRRPGGPASSLNIRAWGPWPGSSPIHLPSGSWNWPTGPWPGTGPSFPGSSRQRRGPGPGPPSSAIRKAQAAGAAAGFCFFSFLLLLHGLGGLLGGRSRSRGGGRSLGGQGRGGGGSGFLLSLLGLLGFFMGLAAFSGAGAGAGVAAGAWAVRAGAAAGAVPSSQPSWSSWSSSWAWRPSRGPEPGPGWRPEPGRSGRGAAAGAAFFSAFLVFLAFFAGLAAFSGAGAGAGVAAGAWAVRAGAAAGAALLGLLGLLRRLGGLLGGRGGGRSARPEPGRSGPERRRSGAFFSFLAFFIGLLAGFWGVGRRRPGRPEPGRREPGRTRG